MWVSLIQLLEGLNRTDLLQAENFNQQTASGLELQLCLLSTLNQTVDPT